jgi:hypothetical protein
MDRIERDTFNNNNGGFGFVNNNNWPFGFTGGNVFNNNNAGSSFNNNNFGGMTFTNNNGGGPGMTFTNNNGGGFGNFFNNNNMGGGFNTINNNNGIGPGKLTFKFMTCNRDGPKSVNVTKIVYLPSPGSWFYFSLNTYIQRKVPDPNPKIKQRKIGYTFQQG